jgi:hypothetical protein
MIHICVDFQTKSINMKHLLLLSILFLQVIIYGQTVPNGTFETWTSTTYNDPNGFSSANARDIMRTGVASVTKVAGVSGFAVRVQTHVSGTDTSESYFVNIANPCSSPPDWVGGVPYSQKPTAFTGYYRCNLPGNDSALMIVIFRKNGVHISDNYFMIRGTGNQSTFTTFSFPLSMSVTPDTMIFAAASSNKISNIGVQNGSFLELDNLAFTGTTQAFPNGDFESWTAKNYDIPSGWGTWSDGVTRSTGSFAGTYAVRIETTLVECNGGNPNSSGITNGYMSYTSGPMGGRPYTLTNDTLAGYYKYAPMGNDSAMINISLLKNSNDVGGTRRFLHAAANYTYFEIPFGASTTPDTLRVEIGSSYWITNPGFSGSVLYIDNLKIKSQPVGIQHNYLNERIMTYPNPVKDQLTIQFSDISGNKKIVLCNALGECISTWNTDDHQFAIDTKSLPGGIYFLQMQTANGITARKFVK